MVNFVIVLECLGICLTFVALILLLNGEGAREQKLLKKVLNASLQRLLREPIREMKRLDTEEEQEEYKRFVRQLFQI